MPSSAPSIAPPAGPASAGRAPGRRRRFVRRAGLVLALVATVACGYLAGGFLRFAQEVAEFGKPRAIERADGIVVLTGGAMRLDQAIGLLKDGRAKRLLISGVNPVTSVATLSRLTDTDRIWFDCCVDLDYAALNTIGNAEMTERWAKSRGFNELILVTSDYHMPRTLMEFDRFSHVPVIKPYAVTRGDLWTAGSMPTARGAKVLLLEYAKLLAARVRMATGLEGGPPVSETAGRAQRAS